MPVVGKENPNLQQESVLDAALAHDARQTREIGMRKQPPLRRKKKPQSLKSRDSALPREGPGPDPKAGT